MFKKIAATLFICCIFFAFPFSNVGASEKWLENLQKTGGNAGYQAAENPLPLVSSIIQVALSLLGVIFLILVIYGGFLWMTAAGDEGKVDSAKKIITAAIIGLIIIVSAYAISYFVVDKLIVNTLS